MKFFGVNVRNVLSSVVGLLLGSNAWAAEISTVGDLDSNWKPLYALVDQGLQKQLTDVVNKKPQWKRLANQHRLAIGVVDLNGAEPRFARLNGNSMMYAASLPKIAILLAAYVSFEDGSLIETDEIHEDLADMIRVSSNVAATRMIDRIGLKRIGEILSDPTYGFYDESRGGGLWVGKRYSSDTERRGDPMHNISHGATVTQVCRFYYLLSEGRLINPHRSAQMLQELSDPKLHHKFVGELDELAPKAKLFRKSGTWRNYHSDSVMVKGTQWRNYILVAMVESANGEKIIADILPAVESILQLAASESISMESIAVVEH